MLADSKLRQDEALIAMKLAYVAADPDRFTPVLFPDWMDPEELTEERLDEVLDSDEEVEYQIETEYDPNEAEALMASLLQQPSGSFDLGDLGGNDDDGEDWGFGYGELPDVSEDDLLEVPEGLSDEHGG